MPSASDLAQFERIERALSHLVGLSGATLLVLSPGSRSTPMILAAERAGIDTHDVIDERSAGFFALGHARVTGVPAPLICTSGTALAHYLPALIEAHETRTPMIVLSADRPPELHGCGANQTIPQRGIFSRFVLAEDELGLELPWREVEERCARLADACRQGPVHLNVPARKPLEPEEALPPLIPRDSAAAAALQGGQGRALDEKLAEQVTASLPNESEAARGGFIVCGPLALARSAEVRDAVHRLAARTGFPIFAEATSQLRHGPGPDRLCCLDALGRSAAARKALQHHTILQIGGAPIAKGYELLLREHQGVRIAFAAYGHPDPLRSATAVHSGPLDALLDLAALRWTAPAIAQESAPRLDVIDARYRSLTAELLASESFTEAQVVETTSRALGPDDFWFIGNSLAVRNVDAWTTPGHAARGVLHQRGVSGIDGNIAGSCGSAEALGQNGAVIALLGDVTALHDIGGLGSFRGGTLIVIVVNNGGGRIFEQLPIASRKGAPMHHFSTEHSADFSHAAALYGHRYARVGSAAKLGEEIRRAKARTGLTLVEARVPHHDATARNRKLWSRFDRLVTDWAVSS